MGGLTGILFLSLSAGLGILVGGAVVIVLLRYCNKRKQQEKKPGKKKKTKKKQRTKKSFSVPSLEDATTDKRENLLDRDQAIDGVEDGSVESNRQLLVAFINVLEEEGINCKWHKNGRLLGLAWIKLVSENTLQWGLLPDQPMEEANLTSITQVLAGKANVDEFDPNASQDCCMSLIIGPRQSLNMELHSQFERDGTMEGFMMTMDTVSKLYQGPP